MDDKKPEAYRPGKHYHFVDKMIPPPPAGR
jgi:hypothetical protein